MEDIETSKQLEFEIRNNGTSGQCIICRKRLRDSRRYEGGEQTEKEATLLEKMTPEPVVNRLGFLTTFNQIWRVLRGNSSGGSDSEDDISLETVITKGPVSKATFSKAPVLCQLCCDKVVDVENLMKAVRQQVREIKMLWEEARRKGRRFDHFEKEHDAGQTEDLNADTEVKEEEEEEWHWQESAGSRIQKQPILSPCAEELSNPSIKCDPESEKETEMECDEDLANSLEDQDEGAADDDTMAEDDEEDDSNWEWEDDDPDYIKSEQEDSNEEDEDLTSEEELDEEPLTLEENQSASTIPNDPLEISFSTTTTPQKSTKSTKPGQCLKQVSCTCDVNGCTLKFPTVSNLYAHKRKYHSSPIPARNLGVGSKKSKTIASDVSSSPKLIPCDLEACTQSFPNKESLQKHKLLDHTKLMIQMGKLNPQHKFICSCGRRYATQLARYTHQRKNTETHPEFKFKLREIRNELIGGQPCDFCGDPVKLSNILEHLTNHVGAEYVVKCPNFNECGHAFTNSKDMLNRHLRLLRFKSCNKICNERKFGLACETCGYTTNNRWRLSNHVANEHERGTLPKNLKCPISGCGKMFAVKQSIFLHLHVHRSRRITNQNCDKCGGDIKVEEMEGHLKDKHGIMKAFGCKQCPLKFSGRDELVEHLWEHRDAGLSCDICGDDKPVKYLKYSDFRDHYFGVHKLCPKRYKCGDCENRWFWKMTELNKHKLDNHKEGEASSSSSLSVDKKNKKKNKNKLFCDICNVSFTTANTLISHKIRVHGEDPFRCDICGEAFHQKAKFNNHMKEHAGMDFQKEWKCEVEGCGKVFKERKLWKYHVDFGHAVRSRPHVCEICGKAFISMQALKNHRDGVHLRLRPWVCDNCGESFSAETTLIKHKLIHTGERPFGCEICGQRFRYKQVLSRHMKGHEEKGADFKPLGPMKQLRKRKGQ